MTTHATSGKQWTESELASLPVEHHFRLRGLEVSRLDTFIDAAFAFVLTLLVISFDEIPSNFADMVDAMKRIPAFAFSFAALMMFWLAHRRWSRRYGVEDSGTIPVSLAVIFVVLVYVYPLRTISEGLFADLSGGYFPSSFRISNDDELRGVLVFFSAGFLTLSLLFNQLYRVTLPHSTSLALNEIELRLTRVNMHAWAVAASFGLVSILLALTVPDSWIPVAGYLYLGLLLAMALPSYLDRRSRARE
jgi:uncharacterized membrane protein